VGRTRAARECLLCEGRRRTGGSQPEKQLPGCDTTASTYSPTGSRYNPENSYAHEAEEQKSELSENIRGNSRAQAVDDMKPYSILRISYVSVKSARKRTEILKIADRWWNGGNSCRLC